MNNAIEANHLTKRYGDVLAVNDVSLAVAPGEVFGLLGPNGAGKTTTVEMLLGLRQPDIGQVRLLGMEQPKHQQAVRQHLGVQLQSTGLLSHLRVIEQIDLFRGLFPQALPAEALLDLVALSENRKTLTKALSGGQKQRLVIALALVNDPELIFLDEPTTGLDPQARRAIWDVICNLRQQGKTVLLTTHYMEEAEYLCDRVGIMDHGQIIELNSPKALIHKYFEETAIEFNRPPGVSRELLQRLPGVSQTLFENGRAALYSLEVPQTMISLYQYSADQQFELENITIRQASLEDVFLKLTGKRIRA